MYIYGDEKRSKWEKACLTGRVNTAIMIADVLESWFDTNYPDISDTDSVRLRHKE